MTGENEGEKEQGRGESEGEWRREEGTGLNGRGGELRRGGKRKGGPLVPQLLNDGCARIQLKACVLNSHIEYF